MTAALITLLGAAAGLVIGLRLRAWRKRPPDSLAQLLASEEGRVIVVIDGDPRFDGPLQWSGCFNRLGVVPFEQSGEKPVSVTGASPAEVIERLIEEVSR